MDESKNKYLDNVLTGMIVVFLILLPSTSIIIYNISENVGLVLINMLAESTIFMLLSILIIYLYNRNM